MEEKEEILEEKNIKETEDKTVYHHIFLMLIINMKAEWDICHSTF